MIKEDNLKIEKLIFFFSAVILLIDWTAKIIKLPYPAITVIKWIITVSYPIIAIYIFSIGFTIKNTDFKGMKNPKMQKLMAYGFRYFFQFTAVLLVPSCLAYWFSMQWYITSSLKIAAGIIYPITAGLLFWSVRHIIITPKNDTAKHNTCVHTDAE